MIKLKRYCLPLYAVLVSQEVSALLHPWGYGNDNKGKKYLRTAYVDQEGKCKNRLPLHLIAIP